MLEFKSFAERPGRNAASEMCRRYTGELLSNLNDGGSVFEEWLVEQREEMRGMLIDRVTEVFDAHDALADPKAVSCARHLLAIDVANEPAFRILMLEAAHKSDPARLHQLYERCEREMHREFGVSVSSQTRELYERLAGKLNAPLEWDDTSKPELRPPV
ncbi:MAG: hypothetical protein HC788_11675 [Sphingopyxis sp.]|nr:hypothetical protein [Sphingopyxis sp.]